MKLPSDKKALTVSQNISIEEVIRAIVLQAGLSREDIQKKISDTIATFNGLLTPVGAALIIADKLNVKVNMNVIDSGSQHESASIDSIKIKDLIDGMKNIVVFGRVTTIFPPKTFQRQDGRKGMVGSLLLRDATGTARVTMWDQKAGLLESSIKEGDIIGIYNASTKIGINGKIDVNVDARATVKPKPEEIDVSQFPEDAPVTVLTSQSIKDIKETTNFCNFTAKVLGKEPVKEFQKKDGTSGTLGKVKVGDEYATAFVLFWSDRMNDFESLNIGEVYDFEGLGVKKNKFSNALEFNINRITRIKKSSKDLDVKISDASSMNTSTSQALIENFKEIPQNAFSINVKGKIALKFDVKSFNKNGKEGKVARIKLIDNDQQAITVVFWTERIGDFEALNIGDVIELRDVNSKLNRDQVELSIKASTTITTIGQETVQVVDFKINDLKDNQVTVSFEGRVKTIEEERQVTLRDGTQVSLIDFLVGDETGSINVVAWRDMVDEVKNLNAGDAIKIENVNINYNKFRNGLEARMVPTTKLSKLKDSTLPTIDELPQDQAIPRTFSGVSAGAALMINKIVDIKDNQVNVTFEGRIKSIENEREVTLKDGMQTRNINFIVGDETGSINVVAWRDMVDVVKKFEKGTAVKIENVNIGFSNFRNMMEAKMGKFSKITEDQESSLPALDEMPQEQIQLRGIGMSKAGPVQRISLDKVEANMRGEVLGQITNISKFINHYLACPKCNKKVTEQNGTFSCVNDGKVLNPTPRLITRITVDDGSGNISVSMIGDIVVELFGINEQEKQKLAKDQDVENIMESVSNRILLKPYRFQGRVKYNEFRNEFEIMADKVLEPEMGTEIKALVTKIESAS